MLDSEEIAMWIGEVRKACKEPRVADMLGHFDDEAYTAAEWSGFLVATLGSLLHDAEQEDRAPLAAAVILLARDLAKFKDKMATARAQ